MNNLREAFFQIFGGREKFDCWLTKMADLLAYPEKLSTDIPELQSANLPLEALSWMTRPHEVLDHILDRIEVLGGWE